MDGPDDHDLLMRLDTKIDLLTVAVKEFTSEQKCCNANFESRLRTVEIEGSHSAKEGLIEITALKKDVDSLKQFKWVVVGVATTISVVIAAISNFICQYLPKG